MSGKGAKGLLTGKTPASKDKDKDKKKKTYLSLFSRRSSQYVQSKDVCSERAWYHPTQNQAKESSSQRSEDSPITSTLFEAT
ncbi:hypothetical protein OROMI_032825 [Orobanche minor]